MKRFHCLLAVLLPMMLAACGENPIGGENDSAKEESGVVTQGVGKVDMISATIMASIKPEYRPSAKEYGIILSTEANPTLQNGEKIKAYSFSGDGVFSVTASGLHYGTEYFYKAYLDTGNGVHYGEIARFSTVNIEAIDLGLSVKWGSQNLNALTPEDSGNYYAWGEAEPKKADYYKWSSVPDANGITHFLKYSVEANNGYPVDNKTELETGDDAAIVALGNGWRMPRKQELEDLYNTRENVHYKWEWNRGWKITYTVNGNSIFLPAAGILYDNLELDQYNTVYRSSTLHSSGMAWCLGFYYPLDDAPSASFHFFERSLGCPIRPVTE